MPFRDLILDGVWRLRWRDKTRFCYATTIQRWQGVDGFEYLGDVITKGLDILGAKEERGEGQDHSAFSSLVRQPCARAHTREVAEVKRLLQTLSWGSGSTLECAEACRKCRSGVKKGMGTPWEDCRVSTCSILPFSPLEIAAENSK